MEMEMDDDDDPPLLRRLLLLQPDASTHHQPAPPAVAASVLLLPASPDFLCFRGRVLLEEQQGDGQVRKRTRERR